VYNPSNNIERKSPREQATTPAHISRAAQVACDNNNFKSVNAQLTNNLSAAVIDGNKIALLRDLNPPSLKLNLPHQYTKQGAQHATGKRMQISQHQSTDIFLETEMSESTRKHRRITRHLCQTDRVIQKILTQTRNTLC
jgi:hypothetical protein